MDLEVFFGNKHAGPLQAFDVRYTVDTVDQNALQVGDPFGSAWGVLRERTVSSEYLGCVGGMLRVFWRQNAVQASDPGVEVGTAPGHKSGADPGPCFVPMRSRVLGASVPRAEVRYSAVGQQLGGRLQQRQNVAVQVRAGGAHGC